MDRYDQNVLWQQKEKYAQVFKQTYVNNYD